MVVATQRPRSLFSLKTHPLNHTLLTQRKRRYPNDMAALRCSHSGRLRQKPPRRHRGISCNLNRGLFVVSDRSDSVSCVSERNTCSSRRSVRIETRPAIRITGSAPGDTRILGYRSSAAIFRDPYHNPYHNELLQHIGGVDQSSVS